VDDREPAISPDGSRIVWVRRTADGSDEIMIAYSLQDNSRPGFVPQMYKLVGDNGKTESNERRPSWTPDGTRIVFQSDRPLTEGGDVKDNDIYIVSVPPTKPTSNANRSRYHDAVGITGRNHTFDNK
jgi:Tol biopolymer transport system component